MQNAARFVIILASKYTRLCAKSNLTTHWKRNVKVMRFVCLVIVGEQGRTCVSAYFSIVSPGRVSS